MSRARPATARNFADRWGEVFGGPLVRLVPGHVAVWCAMTGQITAQEEVITGRGVSMRS